MACAREGVVGHLRRFGLVPAAALGLLLLLWVGPASGRAAIEAYRGQIRIDDKILAGANGRVRVVIDAWTAEQVRADLLGRLLQSGQEGLARALAQLKPVGTLYVGQAGEYPISYAVAYRDRWHHLVLLIDRPVEELRAGRRPRRARHEITLLDLRLDDEGHGEGVAVVGVDLLADAAHRSFTAEGLARARVRLLELRRER